MRPHPAWLYLTIFAWCAVWIAVSTFPAPALRFYGWWLRFKYPYIFH